MHRTLYLCFFVLMAGACSDQPASMNPNPAATADTMATNIREFTFLALGDSYTIGESVEEDDRWPVQLADTLNTGGVAFADPEIIARTGWRTDELITAIREQDPEANYDLVSLLIGVNNQYQGRSMDTYREEFSQLLETALELAGGKPENVLVVSIPDYGYTPFGAANQEKISRELAAFNAANREITEAAGIRYVYITDISENGLSDPSLIAADGLHPSGKQYRQWAGRILEDTSFRARYLPD